MVLDFLFFSPKIPILLRPKLGLQCRQQARSPMNQGFTQGCIQDSNSLREAGFRDAMRRQAESRPEFQEIQSWCSSSARKPESNSVWSSQKGGSTDGVPLR